MRPATTMAPQYLVQVLILTIFLLHLGLSTVTPAYSQTKKNLSQIMKIIVFQSELLPDGLPVLRIRHFQNRMTLIRKSLCAA